MAFWQRSSRLPVFSKASRGRDKREEGLKTSNREQYIPPPPLYTWLIFLADFVPRNHHSNRFKTRAKGIMDKRGEVSGRWYPPQLFLDWWTVLISRLYSLSRFSFLLRRRSKGEYIYIYICIEVDIID